MELTPAPTDTATVQTAESRPESTLRVLLTVEQAAERLSISRTNMFKLIKAKHIESVRIGQLRRIPATAVDTFVRRLIAEQNAA